MSSHRCERVSDLSAASPPQLWTNCWIARTEMFVTKELYIVILSVLATEAKLVPNEANINPPSSPPLPAQQVIPSSCIPGPVVQPAPAEVLPSGDPDEDGVCLLVVH